MATLFIQAGTVSADIRVADGSAELRANSLAQVNDPRVFQLRSFLEKYNSPLACYAGKFIAEADKNDLDWRLVAAITGVESTFGKQIPYNSYNAYGWVNGDYSFPSWETSIEVVSKTLKQNYLDKGAVSIDQIARRYAPPSSTWAWKVKYFMKKIDTIGLSFSLEG